MTPDVYFFSPDLLFGSRVMATTERVGKHCQMAALDGLEDIAPNPTARLIILDLSQGAAKKQLIQNLRRACPNAKVIAFGPHVDDVTLAAARDAGCDEVQTRGQFHREYALLIANTFAVA